MTTQTETQTASQAVRATSTPFIPRGPLSTTLNFFCPPADGLKPHNYVEAPPEGRPQRNFGDNSVDVTINDVRGHESDFSIDSTGFAAITNVAPSAETSFTDDESIKSKYYPEVERLLLDNVPGANRIFFFDHTVRRADPKAKRNPVTRVHIDQTPASAAARVRHHLPNEAEELLKGRVRLINVWRPINGAVESSPLAFADSRTVLNEQLVPIEHRYPDRNGETAAVKYSPEQKWWYWSGIGDDERILLQCFDNQGTEARVPHTALTDPRSTESSKPRESIEVRALVFG